MLVEIFKGLLLTTLTDIARGEYSFFKLGIHNFLDKEVKTDEDYVEVINYVSENIRDHGNQLRDVISRENIKFFIALKIELNLLQETAK